LLDGSAITTTGGTVQLTLRGRTSGNYTVQRVSLVEREGNTLNGVDGTNRQVTFGGTWDAGVTVPAGGTVTSDPIPFDLIAGQDVFLTFWVPSGNPTIYRTGGASTSAWTITGTDQSATIDWESLAITDTRTYIYIAEQLEVLSQSGSGTPPDTTPPAVTLTTPSAGTVSGTLTVTASASDNVGVAGVQFHLDSANLGPEDTTNDYTSSWDTTTVPDGTYALTATARDAAGNTTSSSPITVTVTNTSTPPPPPPPPSILTISNLTVASGRSYVVPTAGLQVGGKAYIDRSYTFTTVSGSVQGAAYIQTANNDKAATNATFLSFDVNQPVTVYVAHDVRITPKPAWLANFTDTGEDLVTSDTTLHLFAKSFAAGTITLGGNAGSGRSMYSVVVVP
jgi:hypothetical protein